MRMDTDYQTQELKNVVDKIQNRLFIAWKTNNDKEIEACIDTLNHIHTSITLPKGKRTYAITE